MYPGVKGRFSSWQMASAVGLWLAIFHLRLSAQAEVEVEAWIMPARPSDLIFGNEPMTQLGAILDFADALIFVMAIPNIIGLYIMAPEVKADLKEYWERLDAAKNTASLDKTT